jgi:hypothetical protein
MRKSTSSTLSRRARAGLATGVVGAVLVATAMPALGASALLSLSSPTGPSGGLNTVTATAPTGIFTTAFTPAVEFEYVGTAAAASCAATYVAAAAIAVGASPTYTQTAGVLTVPAGNVKKLSTSKLAVTVPSTVVLTGGQPSAKYNMCVYNGTTVGTSALIGNAPYTIAAKATLTTITPATGPALGGTTVTVVGTNFPATGMTASIGGQALTNIVVASGGTSFTATTPAHAASAPLTLSVTTSGGVTTKLAAFSYTNGIIISPNTGPNSSATPIDVDVLGVGFTAIDFSTTTTGQTPDNAFGHVYLVNGKYNAKTATGNKTQAEVAECTSVLVITDTELICSLLLSKSLNAAGGTAIAPANRTVTDAVTATSTALTSATADFTAADVGAVVAGAGITAGTYIASVTNATTVVLSAATTATATGVTVAIGAARANATGATTSASATVTGTGTAFFASDVGRAISGAGIPLGATITAYGSATSVTISAPATATGTGVTLTIGDVQPVPEDTYTLTVVSNGQQDIQTGGTNEDLLYTQSIVSSGSTFTVSDY